MAYSLGIDVGGTNTDAVLYDLNDGCIAAYAKSTTYHDDYRRSLTNALTDIFGAVSADRGEIRTVNVATTLSTNAILERQIAPVNLLLIGYQNRMNLVRQITDAIAPSNVFFADGGHTSRGDVLRELDVAGIERFAGAHRGEMFAVSGIFSPRNPEHELRAREIIRTAGCRGVSCGHEMAQAKLNAVKRTTTAYLNSSLMPLIETFIAEIESTLQNHGVDSPVMFLKSDSTLVSSEWCKAFPIETVFSGPAASMRGACHLLRERGPKTFVVVDIGGTSTDIGRIEEGRPVFSQEGAVIGAYRTMIPSLAIHSSALGGDSAVAMGRDGEIEIGPRRVVPYCRKPEETQVECGYTPTDAMNALGKTELGQAALSKKASAALGRESGLSGDAFASAVWQASLEKLEAAVDASAAEHVRLPRAYIGAPGPVCAASLGEERVVGIDTREAGVAGAVGAATSAVELSCAALLVHCFEDETYFAFLPHKKLHGDVLEQIIAASEEELELHLRSLAKVMGIVGGEVELKREYVYFGGKQASNTLASICIVGRFLKPPDDQTKA